ncbi:MAG: AI-2E family transporter [Ardenticatenaceae bacterium]|nr:AI-2E family transporter [Ardenticatenaceae bacterium]MCB9445217.1 AI-2E family transporter [Ardenticatenaceae bacterium]
MKQQKIDMKERISLQVWLALFSLGLALWLAVTYVQDILAIGWVLFGAILLSLALQPLANRLSRYHIPRGVTVFVTYVAGAALLVGLGYLLAPIINQDVTYLQTNGSTLIQSALTRLANTPLARWIPSRDTFVQNLSQRLDTIITGAAGTLASVSNLFLDLSVVFILAYFITAHDGRWSERLVVSWFPSARQAHVREILDNTRQRLARWVLAQLAVALFFMVTFSIGLTLLRTPFALTIGIVSGLLCLIPIPYLGAFVATALTAVSAATGNPWQIFWVAAYTLLVSAVEAHILLPVLYGRAVGLDSAVVLLALLAGAKIGGIVGVFFAVPAAVIALTILQEIQAATVGKTMAE